MANPHRGSVALQVGGRAYTLSFSVNALCELEDALGQPVAQIANALNDPDTARLSTVRALVWAGLRDHHDEVGVKEAGDIITDAGIPACMEAIGKAFKAAFPEQEAKENARPRKAKA
ncbi:GTA-gp10 family protein [Chelativorans sp. Marseille-P2723]|uniref:GTA-gp10 family protein n=1 Tax=Chelativorans sp. Marseille-P2723 TaxID=2709133 RepID=UPI0015710F78|nr:GTA-gp10 family protein [Chelativorans sp. Marseille-P2723]